MSTAKSLGLMSSDSVTIALTKYCDTTYRVRSIQLISGGMHSSFFFDTSRTIESVLVSEFADRFLALLNTQKIGSEPITLPDFEVFLPGVGVSGLRIDPAHGVDEPGSVRLSFDRHVGDMNRVLCFLPSADLPSATVRERIAVEVLSDIVSPIFDLISLSEPSSRDILKSHSGVIEARLKRLADQQEELSFYTGMLKRYVAGCQQDSIDLNTDDVDDQLALKKRRTAS
ncbi:hypothetical protein [Litoreibacter halocynthiae]|uniref:hypothetical protein n=1 Tax=Litoreibacter halocynthiae TaxID=1242689 RepID=UPI002490032C|nr:hypothetical protein [Litoreibacter halocynthiae]